MAGRLARCPHPGSRPRRVERPGAGSPGDARPVGDGISEMRIDCGPGYRAYFKKQGRTIIVLLAGGDKRTRSDDVKTALRLARNPQVGTMTRTTTSPYDVAEHLRTREDMAAYLEACMEEADGDAAFIAKALGDIARARGMSQVACDAGLSRESLYKALSGERNPTLDTVLRVIGALGLKLRAEAVLDSDTAGQGVSAHR